MDGQSFQERDVLFSDEVAALLRISRRTLNRRLAAGLFPIPPLPRLDDRPRWSRRAVEAFLESHGSQTRRR